MSLTTFMLLKLGPAIAGATLKVLLDKYPFLAELAPDLLGLLKDRAAEERMHQTIAQTQQRVENLRREIDVVKVNDSVQKAQAAVASQGAGAASRLGSAADSLKRIKERKAIQEEKFKAAGELEDRRTGERARYESDGPQLHR